MPVLKNQGRYSINVKNPYLFVTLNSSLGTISDREINGPSIDMVFKNLDFNEHILYKYVFSESRNDRNINTCRTMTNCDFLEEKDITKICNDSVTKEELEKTMESHDYGNHPDLSLIDDNIEMIYDSDDDGSQYSSEEEDGDYGRVLAGKTRKPRRVLARNMIDRLYDQTITISDIVGDEVSIEDSEDRDLHLWSFVKKSSSKTMFNYMEPSEDISISCGFNDACNRNYVDYNQMKFELPRAFFLASEETMTKMCATPLNVKEIEVKCQENEDKTEIRLSSFGIDNEILMKRVFVNSTHAVYFQCNDRAMRPKTSYTMSTTRFMCDSDDIGMDPRERSVTVVQISNIKELIRYIKTSISCHNSSTKLTSRDFSSGNNLSWVNIDKYMLSNALKQTISSEPHNIDISYMGDYKLLSHMPIPLILYLLYANELIVKYSFNPSKIFNTTVDHTIKNKMSSQAKSTIMRFLMDKTIVKYVKNAYEMLFVVDFEDLGDETAILSDTLKTLDAFYRSKKHIRSNGIDNYVISENEKPKLTKSEHYFNKMMYLSSELLVCNDYLSKKQSVESDQEIYTFTALRGDSTVDTDSKIQLVRTNTDNDETNAGAHDSIILSSPSGIGLTYFVKETLVRESLIMNIISKLCRGVERHMIKPEICQYNKENNSWFIGTPMYSMGLSSAFLSLGQKDLNVYDVLTQMVDVINSLRSSGFCHKDIKTSNFRVKVDRVDDVNHYTIMFIDWEIAERTPMFIDKNTGKIIPFLSRPASISVVTSGINNLHSFTNLCDSDLFNLFCVLVDCLFLLPIIGSSSIDLCADRFKSNSILIIISQNAGHNIEGVVTHLKSIFTFDRTNIEYDEMLNKIPDLYEYCVTANFDKVKEIIKEIATFNSFISKKKLNLKSKNKRGETINRRLISQKEGNEMNSLKKTAETAMLMNEQPNTFKLPKNYSDTISIHKNRINAENLKKKEEEAQNIQNRREKLKKFKNKSIKDETISLVIEENVDENKDVKKDLTNLEVLSVPKEKQNRRNRNRTPRSTKRIYIDEENKL